MAFIYEEETVFASSYDSMLCNLYLYKNLVINFLYQWSSKQKRYSWIFVELIKLKIVRNLNTVTDFRQILFQTLFNIIPFVYKFLKISKSKKIATLLSFQSNLSNKIHWRLIQVNRNCYQDNPIFARASTYFFFKLQWNRIHVHAKHTQKKFMWHDISWNLAVIVFRCADGSRLHRSP